MPRIHLVPVEEGYPTLDCTILGDQRLLIGRSSGSDLRLAPAVVSSRHAELWLSPDGSELLLTDYSRNGVRVQRGRGLGEAVRGCTHSSGAADTLAVRSGTRVVLVSARELTPPTISYTVLVDEEGEEAPAPAAARWAAGKRKAEGPPGGSSAAQSAPRARSRGGVSASCHETADALDSSAPARLRKEGLAFITDRRITDDFEVGAFVQEGGFSKVFRCTERSTGKLFAVKRVDKASYSSTELHNAHEPSNMRKEVEILHSLRHHHVVRLFQVYDDPQYLWIVQEFINGGELFDKVQSKRVFEEDKARGLFRQLCEGVAFLHSQGVVHRDLKPENILLQRCSIEAGQLVPLPPDAGSSGTSASAYTSTATVTLVAKIADFGMATLVGPPRATGSSSSGGGERTRRLCTVVGTDKYMAPELYVADALAKAPLEPRLLAEGYLRERTRCVTAFARLHPRVLQGGESPEAAALLMSETWSSETVAALTRQEGYAGPAVDSWALGTMLYVLLGGTMPFYVAGQGEPQRPKAMLHQALARFYCTSGGDWGRVSANARDLIDRLLEPNPDLRMLPAQALLHPWLAREASPRAPPKAAPAANAWQQQQEEEGTAAELPAGKRARVR